MSITVSSKAPWQPVDARDAPPAPRAQHRFPAVAPPGLFDGHRWLWRSETCSALGHHFEVLCAAPDLTSALQLVTAPLRSGTRIRDRQVYRVLHQPGEELPFAMYLDETRLLMSSTAEPILRFLTWHVNRRAITTGVRRHVLLHAAGATRAGVAVLLPGGQEHGKTTTVAGLLQEGYGYITDEALALDVCGLGISPFPKALSIDEGSWPLFPQVRPRGLPSGAHQWQVPSEHLGGHGHREPLVPRQVAIVFPRYTEGVRTAATPLTRAEALRELVQCTFEFERDVPRNLSTLRRFVEGAVCARLAIGSLADAVLAIETLVSDVILEECS